MGKPPAYLMYAQDFDMDTGSWSCTAVGIYQRLLNYEWVNRYLPNDEAALSRIARIDRGNFKKCWVGGVGGKFIGNGNGNLINHRMEQVRFELEEYRKRQRESGLEGVKVKKERKIYPFDNSSDPSTDPSSNPTTHNQALQSSSSLKNIYVEDSDELRLASFLLEEVLKNKPDFKRPNLQAWAKDIDLMLRRDGRTPDRIREVIHWAQNDSFWKANILSVGGLRKQFDRLELAMGTKNGKSW